MITKVLSGLGRSENLDTHARSIEQLGLDYVDHGPLSRRLGRHLRAQRSRAPSRGAAWHRSPSATRRSVRAAVPWEPIDSP